MPLMIAYGQSSVAGASNRPGRPEQLRVQRISNLLSSLFVLVVVAALGIHAYGSFTGTGAKAATGSGAIEKGTIGIHIKGLAFPDGNRIVAVGTTVVWTNFDGAVHTVTATDKTFSSGNMAKGKTFSHMFTKVGTHDYACTIHPFMRASITVVQPYGTG